MIEYETIINEIKEEIKTYYNEYCRYANLPDEKIDRKIELVEKLVDKATPMKVDLSTERKEDYTGEDWYYQRYYDCPKCNEEIERYVDYCPYCGQKLDWIEVKDE